MPTLNPSLEQFNSLVEQHQRLFNGAHAEIKPSSIGLGTAFFISGIYSSGTWSNGVAHHDPMLVSIMIEYVGDDKFVASLLDGGSLVVFNKGVDGKSPYTFAPAQVNFRKTTGNAEKIMKAITRWQENRLTLIKEYKDQIPNFSKSNLKDIKKLSL